MISKRGFTLIELLIVVAIIGILAAIAIPNFLQAQTRAKVARAVGEQQSIATGLELYRVDNGNYPLDGGNCSPGPYWYLPNSLTTPIDYISSTLLTDPFRQGFYGGTPPSWLGPGETAAMYERYRYQNIDDTWGGIGPLCTGPFGFYPNMLCVAGHWALHSLGPDRIYSQYAGVSDPRAMAECSYPAWPAIYDPTNGTVSVGNIIRTQKESSYK